MSPIGMKNTRCGEWYNLPQSRERETTLCMYTWNVKLITKK